MSIKTKLDRLAEGAAYSHDGKKAFHSEGKKLLKKVAEALGLSKGQYDLRSNQGGIAVSGEITLHADFIYVQVSQSLGPGATVLVRSCKDRKDYCGDRNNYVTSEALYDPELMRKKIISICQQSGRLPSSDGSVPGFNALAYA